MITGGQNFVSSPPAFSHDGKKLLVCTGLTVSVFSTSTGMLVIPNISRNPVGSNEKSSTLFAIVSVEDINKPADQHKALRGQIQIYNLTNSHHVKGLLAETLNPVFISVSKSGEYIGIPNKRKLHIWKIPRRDCKCDEIKKIKLHHTKKLSTVGFHPNERVVAGGDVTGRILIWRGFGKRKFSEDLRATSKGRTSDEEERSGVRGDDDADICSTYHWHHNEVKFLFFSSDGAYLYSGGNEGVIVVWQLDTLKAKFKPRLGSPLLYFTDSPDPSLSCISCADNQIHLLRMPMMEIKKSIAGIKLHSAFPDGYRGLCSEFAYDHAAGLVALHAEDYCVQFFSLYDNVEVSQVQVCERNFQPADDVTMYVALVSLSTNGFVMGTVDVKLPEEKLGGLVSLKFWTRGSQMGEYLLSTVIYEPHRSGFIALTSKRQIKRFRNLIGDVNRKKPMTAAAFSADGSVLAIAAESVVTMWDPDTNILVAVIGDTLSPITKLSFIGESEYLVSLSKGSKPQLAVWNTSNLSTCWSYNLFAEDFCCTAGGSHFAVLAVQSSPDDAAIKDGDGVILLFDVEDPVPVATWLVQKAKRGGLTFLPPNPSFHDTKSMEGKGTSLLLYINGDHEYVIFDPYSNEENQIGRNAQKSPVPLEEAVRSGYLSIYGELPDFSLKKDQVTHIPFVPSERPWETIFRGSSHVLPPLTKLCSAFLASLLEKRPSINESYP